MTEADMTGTERVDNRVFAEADLSPVRKRRSRVLYTLLQHRAGLIGLIVVVVGTAVAILAPFLTPYDPYEAEAAKRLIEPQWWDGLAAGGYVLGTDQLGRDMVARIIYGARISLAVGFLSVAISAPLGVLVGLIAGFFSGIVDDAMMRVADSQLSIPFILLAIAILSVIGPSPTNVIIVLGLLGWVIYARIVRGEVMSLKRKEYIEAAIVLGASPWRIMLRHLMPNTLTPIIVVATFAVAQMISLEATLSFLGLGVQPPTPSWGQMLADGKAYLNTAWWLTTFPGLAIAITILGVNFMGDWLRDALDPRMEI